MAQEFFDEKKEQELAQNQYLLKKDVHASNIRYNALPGEIFFLSLDYDGGRITFTINKNIIDSTENQVGYVINTVKSKLDMLEQDFLSS